MPLVVIVGDEGLPIALRTSTYQISEEDHSLWLDHLVRYPQTKRDRRFRSYRLTSPNLSPLMRGKASGELQSRIYIRLSLIVVTLFGG